MWYPRMCGTHRVHNACASNKQPPASEIAEGVETPELTGMSTPSPSAAIVVGPRGGQAYDEAKFRNQGWQSERRIGPSWLDLDPASGEWHQRRGRVADGWFDARRAYVVAAEIVARSVGRPTTRSSRGVSVARAVAFREVAHLYLRWHDQRHTHGSLPAASGGDLVTIQAVMGHSAIAATGRYLRARPASDQAAFTRACASPRTATSRPFFGLRGISPWPSH